MIGQMTEGRRITAITGGSRGIGRAIALRLAGQGHDVVVGYRDAKDDALAVVEEVRAQGAQAIACRVDIADSVSVTGFFDTAAAWGPLTGVVANAGAVRAVGPLKDLDPGEVKADLEVNLLGAVLTCQAAIGHLSALGGAIVTIGSAAVSSASPGTYVHYAAAKAGVEALTRGLARELAPEGIRVNCVEPGTVWSQFHQDADRPATVASAIPMGRPGEPDEIAGAVAWLLSADAGYTTGATIRVAGGL